MTTLFCDPTPSCPRCGAEGALPLIFGTPSREMLISEQLGQIALGGSIESAKNLEWACPGPSCRSYF